MNGQRFVAQFAAVFVMATMALACGGDEPLGEMTATPCPDSSTLTWDTDIAPIIDRYCVSCHAASVPVGQRHGAPTDHNFDTQLGVLEEAAHVDQEAGSNGTITNTEMPPPGYPAPSVEERMKVSEWLACTAPENAPHEH